MKRQTGFTLIEILIAMTIYVVVITIVSLALSNMLKSTDVALKNILYFNKVQRTIIDMQRDFFQVLDRPIRDENNNEEPAFVSPDISRDNILTFSTHIRSDVLSNDKQVDVRRVGYRFREGKLYRITWPTLDRLTPTMKEKELLDNVSSVTWEYIAADKRIYNIWPPTPDRKEELPVAIKIQLMLNGDAQIEKIFLITG